MSFSFLAFCTLFMVEFQLLCSFSILRKSSLSLLAGCRVADSTGEIVKGLRCYFDKALPIMLLYKSEREQYEDSMGADVSPSSVYGAEHLLRLFGEPILQCLTY